MVALVWGGVLITGTGVDVLLFVMVCCAMVVINRLVGDSAAELFGPVLASLVLTASVAAAGWYLFAGGGKGNDFLLAAHASGYSTLLYHPGGRPPEPAPVSPAAAGPPPQAETGAGRRAASVAQRPSNLSAGGSLRGSSAALLQALGIHPNEGLTPAVRVEAPDVVVSGSRVTVRAYVTAQGTPLGRVPVVFSANDRSIGEGETDARGVATATMVPEVARTYQIRARVPGTRDLRSAAGGMVLHALPEKSPGRRIAPPD
jgi:hypothetical protein